MVLHIIRADILLIVRTHKICERIICKTIE